MCTHTSNIEQYCAKACKLWTGRGFGRKDKPIKLSPKTQRRLSDNSNNRARLTNNENLKNCAAASNSPMTTKHNVSPCSTEQVLSPDSFYEWVVGWHDCIFRHLCGRHWVSFVSLISCLSVARFNFKSWTHFHEWLTTTGYRTRQDEGRQRWR